MSEGERAQRLQVRVRALQRDTEALYKLLGGDDDDRQRFLEIVLGITTPAIYELIQAQFEAVDEQVKASTELLTTLKANARELAGRQMAQ